MTEMHHRDLDHAAALEHRRCGQGGYMKAPTSGSLVGLVKVCCSLQLTPALQCGPDNCNHQNEHLESKITPLNTQRL